MLPGLLAVLGGGSIAVPATLFAGQNDFDFNGDGVIDATIIGKNPNVGGFSVEPLTGFTCSNFYDKFDGVGSYTESLIWIEGTGASVEIPPYTSVTISGIKRGITWVVENPSRASFTTGTPFNFSNGGQYSILFAK